MRILLTCLALLFPSLTLADEAYERLLSDLAKAESFQEAERLNSAIWQVWLTAPDAEAQDLIDQAQARRVIGDFEGAVAILDQLIAGWPDYAEGWNQRATVLFMAGRYEHSLKDVAEVLEREPRHFGALSGKGLIHLRLGQPALAELAIREAMRHHPYLNERFLLDGLSKDL